MPHANALAWLRANLFSSPFNSAVTLLLLYAAWHIIPALVSWLVSNAVWHAGTPADCAAAGGACWAFIIEKHRLILFGRFPYDQQWRPLLGLLPFAALVMTLWVYAPPAKWLLRVFIASLLALLLLLDGRLLGLPAVPINNWGGVPLTLFLAGFGMVGAFPLAILLALGRRSRLPIIRAACVAYIELIRGVPLISVLFMAAVMIPLFLPDGLQMNQLIRALLGFTLFTAAYLAEVIRGGLQTIPQGQYEAAASLGLGYRQQMQYIILPQALRVSIPPMVNTFIGAFKDTSLVVIVGLMDVLLATRTALADAPWKPYFIEGYVTLALFYFVCCYALARYSRRLEASLNPSGSRA